MSEQGEQGPSEGMQDRMTDVLQELYSVAGYASITWRTPDGSLLSLSRSSVEDEPVLAAVQ